jgi:hypothetical protein
MPLSPLPEWNTPRVLIQYTSVGEPHTLDLRVPIGTVKADAISPTQDVIDAMLPCMDGADDVTGALWIPAGTNVAQTLAVTPGSGVLSGLNTTDEAKTVFISATGRSDDGRKVRWTFFNNASYGETTFRKNVIDFASVFQALYASISGNTFWVTKSGEEPTWHTYFNIGLNSGVQRKLR